MPDEGYDEVTRALRERDIAETLGKQIRDDTEKDIRETQALVDILRESTGVQDTTRQNSLKDALDLLSISEKQDTEAGVKEREVIAKARRRGTKEHSLLGVESATIQASDKPLNLGDLVLDLGGGAVLSNEPIPEEVIRAQEDRYDREKFVREQWPGRKNKWYKDVVDQRSKGLQSAPDSLDNWDVKPAPLNTDAERESIQREVDAYVPPDPRAAKKAEAEAKRQQAQEAREARQRAEEERIRWQSIEDLTDEALNISSEGPISSGVGAASGSNMGKFLRRMKTSGGRLYNAVKGNRPGRNKFTPPRTRSSVPTRGAEKGVSSVARSVAGAAGGGGGGSGTASTAVAAGGAAEGGGAAALIEAETSAGPVGIAAAAVTTLAIAAVEAGKAVYEFARAQEDTVRKMAQFGGQQAVAIARLDVERTFRDIKTAQETGGSSQQLTEAISRFEDKLQPIEIALTNIANIVGSRLLDQIGVIVAIIEPTIRLLEDIAEALGADTNSYNPKTPWDEINRMKDEMDRVNRPKWPQPR